MAVHVDRYISSELVYANGLSVGVCIVVYHIVLKRGRREVGTKRVCSPCILHNVTDGTANAPGVRRGRADGCDVALDCTFTMRC